MRSQLIPWAIAALALVVCAYSHLDRSARPEAPMRTVEARRDPASSARRLEPRAETPWQSERRPARLRVELEDDARELDDTPAADEQPLDQDTRRRDEAAIASANELTDRLIDRRELSGDDVRQVTALVARLPADERAPILEKLGRAINGDQIAYVTAQ